MNINIKKNKAINIIYDSILEIDDYWIDITPLTQDTRLLYCVIGSILTYVGCRGEQESQYMHQIIKDLLK